MNMPFRKVIVFLLFLSFLSCDKHLDEKIYQSKDITVKWYKISSLSSAHHYIDLKRWGYSDNLLNSNTGGIYDIIISGDTITIRTLPDLLIYDLVAKKNGCYIKLDTTVTKYEYMKKFQPENATYYIEQNN